MQLHLWSLIPAFGAIQGLFIATLLLYHKKSKLKENKYLALLIFALSFIMIENVITYGGPKIQYPHLLNVTTIFWYFIGPFVYFYLSELIHQVDKKKHILFHSVGPCVAFITIIPFYLLDESTKSAYVLNARTLDDIGVLHYTCLVVFAIQLCTYLVLIGRKLNRSAEHNPILRNSIYKYIVIGLMVCLFLPMIDTVLFLLGITPLGALVAVHFSVFVLFIFTIILFSILKQNEFFHFQFMPNQTIESKPEDQRLASQLVKVIEENKLYLNEELRQTDLADSLQISRHRLSHIINHELNTDFYQLINSYRVKEAEEKLKDPNYKDLTFLAIAHESGFKSKGSFNRIFKSLTGRTPSEFVKLTSQSAE